MEKQGNTKLDPEIIRRLGRNERYQLAMHTLGQYIGTVIACRYTIPRALAGPEHHEKLVEFFEYAIARTVLQHPLLQVGLVGAKSKKPAWTQLESIDFRKHIEWNATDNPAEFDLLRRKAVQFQLDTEFAELESQPGWRATVLRHYRGEPDFLEVIYSWNHANSDGMGGKIVHQTLLRELNEATTTTKNADGEPATPPPPPPPTFFQDRVLTLPPTIAEHFTPTQHQLAKYPLTADFLLKTLWRGALPRSLTSKRGTEAAWAPIRTSPYATQFRSFGIGAASLGRLLAACRRRGTTLTGLLHALCLASLASQLGAAEARAFEAGSALSMRRFLPARPPSRPWLVPDRTVGNLVSAMPHRFDADVVARIRGCMRDASTATSGLAPLLDEALENTVWEVAAAVRDELVARLEMGVRNDLTGVMKFVGDWHAQMKEAARKPREQSWIVTNLGVLDGCPSVPTGAVGQGDGTISDNHHKINSGKVEGTAEGERGGCGWSIDRAQFVLSAEVASAALMVSPLAVKGKDLVVSVSWQDCVMDSAFGEQFTANLERWCRQLGSET